MYPIQVVVCQVLPIRVLPAPGATASAAACQASVAPRPTAPPLFARRVESATAICTPAIGVRRMSVASS